MGIDEKHFVKTNTQYGNGAVLDEYNGTYSLTSAKQNDKGIWMEWAFPQDRDRQPREKAIPVKVNIGENKQQAIETLRYFISILERKPQQNEEPLPF